ncbi:MAG: hypothetical protein JRI68_08675 [Deltaproteobacteria bacterium]|nr:hypothetical protein [Deltaproteobacteria bacterium]
MAGQRQVHPVALATITLFSGCLQPVLAPPADNPQGSPEMFLQQAPPDPPTCDRPIQLIAASKTITLGHEELGQISVTCLAGVPNDCEDRLRAHACERGADAVQLERDDPSLTRPEYAAGGPQQRTLRGLAIRWTD